jgi:hypothetical protein
MTGRPTSLLERRDYTSQREGTEGDGHDMQLFTASSGPQIISASANRLKAPQAKARRTYSDSRDESQKSVTRGEKRSYHRPLGEIDGHISAGKEEVSMARIPSPQPLFSDDSWGLLLVPIVTCVALVVSALLWL